MKATDHTFRQNALPKGRPHINHASPQNGIPIYEFVTLLGFPVRPFSRFQPPETPGLRDKPGRDVSAPQRKARRRASVVGRQWNEVWITGFAGRAGTYGGPGLRSFLVPEVLGVFFRANGVNISRSTSARFMFIAIAMNCQRTGFAAKLEAADAAHAVTQAPSWRRRARPLSARFPPRRCGAFARARADSRRA